MSRRRFQKGSALLETAMFLPILILLLVGMVAIAKVTYTYYTLEKTMYTLARYLGSQQGVNFCDDSDPSVTAAKNFAITGTTDNSADPLIAGLTADMLQVRIERYNPDTQDLGVCDCSATGCDAGSGGLAPDFIVVSIPDGYRVQPVIPMLTVDPIPLRPQVRIPFGGT